MPNEEKYRADLEHLVNDRVLYSKEVGIAVRNLGAELSDEKIKADLIHVKINPLPYGLNPKDYDFRRTPHTYTYANAWEYLLDLEGKGLIDLTRSGIDRIEDIIRRHLHKIVRGLERPFGKRHTRHKKQKPRK